MIEVIGGLIILSGFLSIIFLFLFKWWKDYKRTGKLFVLYDKKTKYWLPVFILIFAMLIIAIFTDYSKPVQIKIKEWNPWSWYA